MRGHMVFQFLALWGTFLGYFLSIEPRLPNRARTAGAVRKEAFRGQLVAIRASFGLAEGESIPREVTSIFRQLLNLGIIARLLYM